jgi:hypothetical protein
MLKTNRKVLTCTLIVAMLFAATAISLVNATPEEPQSVTASAPAQENRTTVGEEIPPPPLSQDNANVTLDTPVLISAPDNITAVPDENPDANQAIDGSTTSQNDNATLYTVSGEIQPPSEHNPTLISAQEAPNYTFAAVFASVMAILAISLVAAVVVVNRRKRNSM